MTEFPKLMWQADGTEITVHSLDDQEVELAAGSRLTPAPVEAPPDEVPAIFAPEQAPLVEGEVPDEPETAKKRGSKKK
jgi:hypothetical protein